MVLGPTRENHLCSWFTAKSRFLKVRECYFALLIPGKWEFWEEYVQTIKCLLQLKGKVLSKPLLSTCCWTNLWKWKTQEYLMRIIINFKICHSIKETNFLKLAKEETLAKFQTVWTNSAVYRDRYVRIEQFFTQEHNSEYNSFSSQLVLHYGFWIASAKWTLSGNYKHYQ